VFFLTFLLPKKHSKNLSTAKGADIGMQKNVHGRSMPSNLDETDQESCEEFQFCSSFKTLFFL
jgi:hypothetical protein